MSRPRNILNIRSQLERIVSLQETLDKYGYCPVARTELAMMALIAKGTLRKHSASGTRKDLRLESAQ